MKRGWLEGRVSACWVSGEGRVCITGVVAGTSREEFRTICKLCEQPVVPPLGIEEPDGGLHAWLFAGVESRC